MGTIFASVWGEVALPLVDILRKEIEVVQMEGLVFTEEETRITVRGTLQHLCRIESLLQQKIIKLDADAKVSGFEVLSPTNKILRIPKTELDETKLSESVREFANISEITEHQIQYLGLDKQRGLDTKSKHYEITCATKFECDLCSFKSKRQSHMEKHMRMHESNPTVYSCPVASCPFKCIRNGDLTRHNLISHIDPSQVLSCERCSYKTSDRKCFAKHLKYSHREKEVKNVLYECSKCPYKTMKILFFTRHMKRHGILVDSKTAQTVNTINLKCDLCEYEAKRVEHINRHMDTVHSDERKYLCQICGVGFKRSDALKLHNLTHSTNTEADEEMNKQHGCNQCNKIFQSAATLMEHTLSHEKEKALKCNLCQKIFSSSSLLQKHTKVAHPASSSYVCGVCSKKFNTMFNLKRHTRTHERHPPGNNNTTTNSYLPDQNEGVPPPSLHPGAPKLAPTTDYQDNHNKSAATTLDKT